MAQCKNCGGFVRGDGVCACCSESVGFCFKCGAKLIGSKFCSECGTAAAKPSAAQPQNPALLGWIVIAAVIAGIWMLARSGMDSEPSRPPAAVEEMTAGEAAACMTSMAAVANAKRASASGDTSAMLGMISRKEAVMLAPGDQVKIISDADGLAYVRLLSGFNIGTRCYVARSALR